MPRDSGRPSPEGTGIDINTEKRDTEVPGYNPEERKSEKESEWERVIEEVDKITDRLGKGIDEKIKDSVAAFMAYEFPTSGSCEGHLAEEEEKERGAPYPWVEVYAPEPEDWKENEEKKKEWTIENLKQRQKMTDYLTEFYREREAPFDARLAFSSIGRYGGFRVQSFGAETIPLLTREERKQKLDLYRKEMDDFSRFLKDKFNGYAPNIKE